MATKQITVRIEEDLLNKVHDRVQIIRNESKGLVDVNQATIIRGSLIEFFDSIEKDKNGREKISFYPNQFSNEELENIVSGVDGILENLDKFIGEDKAGHDFVFDLLTMISNKLAYEAIQRKNKRM